VLVLQAASFVRSFVARMTSASHPTPSIAVTVDLVGDLKTILEKSLVAQGFKAEPAERVDVLLERHLNIQNRLIPARPRSVVWSKDLRDQFPSLESSQQQAIQEIEAAAQRGDDLSPRLSRKVVGDKKRGDYNDGLLCD
jgi:hypothetical protein